MEDDFYRLGWNLGQILFAAGAADAPAEFARKKSTKAKSNAKPTGRSYTRGAGKKKPPGKAGKSSDLKTKKSCTKGIACGRSCIAANKTCGSTTLKNTVRAAAEYLKRGTTTSGKKLSKADQRRYQELADDAKKQLGIKEPKPPETVGDYLKEALAARQARDQKIDKAQRDSKKRQQQNQKRIDDAKKPPDADNEAEVLYQLGLSRGNGALNDAQKNTVNERADRQNRIIDYLRIKPTNSGELQTELIRPSGTASPESPERAASLDQSIARHGRNLVPVVLRRVGPDSEGTEYEVVHGDDVLAAAQRGGVARMNAHVFDMTAEQAAAARRQMDTIAQTTPLSDADRADMARLDSLGAPTAQRQGDRPEPTGNARADRQNRIIDALRIKPSTSGEVDTSLLRNWERATNTDIPRDRYDAIRASLEQHGTNLVPLTVRRAKLGDDGSEYEVVHGEDWAAVARDVGVARLQTRVADMDDDEAAIARAEMNRLLRPDA